MTDAIRLEPEDIKGYEVNRCYRGRIVAEPKGELYEALLATHTLFNQKVALVMRAIYNVMANKDNPEFAKLTEWAILNISPAGQCASHFANPFTLETSRANPTHQAYNKAPEMKELFHLCKERGDRWYDRSALFGDSQGASGMIMEVNQTAIEKVKSYLELKRLWREGEYEPFANMDQDKFVREVVKFLKSTAEFLNVDDSGKYDPLLTLLQLRPNEQKARLRDIHQYRLMDPELMTALESAYQTFSPKALGKQPWLQQKQAFEQHNQAFLEKYQAILKDYKAQLEQKQAGREIFRLPKRWQRDPNFLQLIDRLGREGFWPEGFTSPLDDPETQAQWAEKQKHHPDLPDLSDWPALVGFRQGRRFEGRDFFVERLKLLNPQLFTGSGWFALWEKSYRRFEGKFMQEFKRPPGLRFPDPKFHPEWINFSNKGCFQYNHLEVTGPAKLTLTVKLINPTTQQWQDYRIQVNLDERLKTLRPAQVFEVPDGYWKKNQLGQLEFNWNLDENEAPKYKLESLHFWTDPDAGETRLISIHGGNMVYKRTKKAFYLHFRYSYKAPYNPKMRVEDGSGEFKAGTRVLAFDLDQKGADAIVAICEKTGHPDNPVIPIKFVPFNFKPNKGKSTAKVYYQWLRLPGGAGFRAINHAEEIRRHKRRKLKKGQSNLQRALQPDRKLAVGKFLVRNQESFAALNRYIQNCRELHYKQLAGVILKIAEANGCHAIVHENLESYRMSVKQERGENRRLMIWAAEKTFNFLETLCKGTSMNLYKLSAAYTSQTCNKCGSWGVRFNFPTKSAWARGQKAGYISPLLGPEPLPRVVAGGNWFVCSNLNCAGKKNLHDASSRYIVQGDANAARNLAMKGLKHGIAQPLPSKEEREAIRNELQAWLNERFSKKAETV